MTYHWSTHQLTEYLVGVSLPRERGAAITAAIERATETLDAEFGAVVIDGELRGSFGFGSRPVPAEFLAHDVGDADDIVPIAGGSAHLLRGTLSSPAARTSRVRGSLIIGRRGEAYSAEEHQLLQGMALVLGLVLHNLDTLRAERSRHQLVETLLAIQRAISARRPLQELLDAITAGASALLGGCPVALLLTDPLAAGALIPASVFDYPSLDDASLALIQATMAHESAQVPGLLAERVLAGGEVAGCLLARPGEARAAGGDQGDLLTAFAQQVSLALTDARTLDAVRQAYKDPITGLPNRALFLERLEQGRRAALAQGLELTVLFIDLDRFKAINDSFGHGAGDEVLAEVAHRITECTRPQDSVARLGGDEFSVLLERSGVQAAEVVAARVIAALDRAFVLAGREVFIGASVGIAPLNAQHEDASALLSDADVAMYCAKRTGRGRSVVFQSIMHDEVVDRLRLRTDLQHAWVGGQLWLAYQPIVRIGSGRLEGAETLMRWQHPTRGAIPPTEFIPVAEETQAIVALGAWALRESLGQAALWRVASPSLGLSVNVSARQIADPDLPGVIKAALAESQVSPEALTLEITESLLMADPDLARTRLTTLKDLGVRLAIDDFGTGYSSLGYLRQFPVDRVKIDRSFVTGLRPGADDDIAVVRSVITLCRSLRLQTVAEGIEEPEQLAILEELGCDLGQGYLFARPMPPAEFATFCSDQVLQ